VRRSSPPTNPTIAALAETEVHSAPGELSIESPAFERNGEIPSQYACDGADMSPPLEWQHVPAKTVSLVLFMIDDTSHGSAGGIRWVVANIDPSARGLAAGAVPAGGVVGSDSQGQGGYGGICPPRGTTSVVEFMLYALNKRLPLSPGFQPTVAESGYSGHLLSSAAVTYGLYTRP
jgi:Raf kinase inhibitor-like YbhB/YbcL family protein